MSTPKRLTEVRPKGFTLIELLVVVAIIVVLIAILLPSLGKARDQARQAYCSANLRQVAMAFRSYSSEFAKRFPMADWSATYGGTLASYEGSRLEGLLAPYTGIMGTGYGSSSFGTWIHVAGKIWICPASGVYVKSGGGREVYAPDFGSAGYNSSGMNCYSGLYYHWNGDEEVLDVNRLPRAGANAGPTWRESFFPWPSQTPIQFCSQRLAVGNPSGSPSSVAGFNAPSWHYPAGRPTAFLDGHVAVLNRPYYKIGQAIMNANITPRIHAYPTGPIAPYYNGAPFALSEY